MEEQMKTLTIITLIISICAIIICLSGYHIVTKERTVNKIIEIDFTGWGHVSCPGKHCLKINNGLDKEGIYCNVPITECNFGEYSVDNYSICYKIWYSNQNSPYLTFNVNNNYGFVDSCVIPIYEKYVALTQK